MSALEKQVTSMEPVHDDRRLFELMCLQAAAAGLNQRMIQKKREGYRRAFDGFDPKKVAGYDHRDFDRLMADEGIVRNRAKIGAFIDNARAFVRVQDEFGSFDRFIWSFVDNSPVDFTDENRGLPEVVGRELKKRGFKFMGPTTVAMFMFHSGMLRWIGEHCPWK
jgi:DNA-3-methyladenine glycosylase I